MCAPALLESADPQGAEALDLLLAMRTEARSRYPEVFHPATPAPSNDLLGPRSAFLIARINGQAAGCAALRPIEAEVGEVKRMYVVGSFRRRGVGRFLLSALEKLAKQYGYQTLRLETGVRQPEAIRLYESSGYRRIPAYGCHVGDPLSICFEKFIEMTRWSPPVATL